MHDAAPLVATVGLMGVEYAKARGIDAAVDSVLGRVVGNVADKRAQRYMSKLVEATAPDAAERDEAEVRTLLDRVTSSEAAAERVFDGYRRSLLSRSRTIGPRVQALLVARLLAEDREATKDEQAIADVAEQCTDQELEELARFWTSLTAFGPVRHLNVESVGHGAVTIVAHWETFRVETRSHDFTGPINLAQFYGRWAGVLEQTGLACQAEERKTEKYEPDLEFVDEDFVERTTKWLVTFEPECGELTCLILQACDEHQQD